MSKRSARGEIIRPSGSNPLSSAIGKHLDSIETLPPLECAFPFEELTVPNIDDAFPDLLSAAQQKIDLWSIFESPTFKRGTNLASYHREWVRLHQLSIEDVLNWRHGEESNSLPQWKPSSAKIATRAIKTYRSIQENPSIADNSTLNRKVQMKELDYLMLMCATQIRAIDNMVPDHQERIAMLFKQISRVNTARPISDVERQTEGGISASSDGKDEMLALAESFRQKATTRQVSSTIPDIVGHESIRSTLATQFAIPTLFGSLLDPKDKIGFQSVLLFGPPGTGKTLLAQSLAATANMTFFKVESGSLTSKYVGDTEKAIKALAEVVKTHKPSIIFMDEIDALTGSRQSGESRHERRSTNALLEMFSTLAEESSIFIVGATNRPWDIDPAFLSRFQRKVYLGLPRPKDYTAMISKFLAGKRTTVSLTHLNIICCSMMHNYTGRDVSNALSGINFSMWEDLMQGSSFVPVDIDGKTYYEPCDADLDSEDRVDQPFKEWPIDQLRPRAISYEALQEALKTVTPDVTDETLMEYEEWSNRFGVKSVE